MGWPQEQFAAKSVDDALKSGKTFVTDDAMAVIAHPEIDVVIEATGDPASGIQLCLAAIRHGKHIVMVNVEADALAGPLLARRASEAGVVYSLAWGDQPALIAEHVDWARACGFQVVSAGKGTRYHPSYHQSTPDTVWDILTQYLPIKDRSHINPKMFNSFLDGTKSGIEMTAVCNATGLVPQTNGLSFPPASRFELADVCKPKTEGGALEKKGVTEVVSSLYRDGKDVPHHLAMGTYVVIESESPYAAQCFVEYNCLQDKSGKYATHVPADAHDRAGAGDFRCVGGAAQGADGHVDLLQLGCGGHRQARAQGRRDAGRRGRFYRVGQAGAGRCLPQGRLPAAGACPLCQTQERHRGGPAAQVVGRGLRCRRAQAVKVRREMEAMFARPNVVRRRVKRSADPTSADGGLGFVLGLRLRSTHPSDAAAGPTTTRS